MFADHCPCRRRRTGRPGSRGWRNTYRENEHSRVCYSRTHGKDLVPRTDATLGDLATRVVGRAVGQPQVSELGSLSIAIGSDGGGSSASRGPVRCCRTYALAWSDTERRRTDWNTSFFFSRADRLDATTLHTLFCNGGAINRDGLTRGLFPTGLTRLSFADCECRRMRWVGGSGVFGAEPDVVVRQPKPREGVCASNRWQVSHSSMEMRADRVQLRVLSDHAV